MNTRLLLPLLLGLAGGARADAVDSLRDFAQNVKSGKASFTQTVTSVDGAKKKTSSGQFEFVRPNRFRFVYAKPFEQQIVADGQKVWLYDVDLNQVTVRPMAQALGATPAALLA
ncbi:MAG TPA: outer membrane lipoprotein chaperone LolA, partial [Burkholderiaceae bacterium]|nr:outer membrane lipoprotein chaperone LolA [Burkholderiaceae bacterium]